MQKLKIAVVSSDVARKERSILLDSLVIVIGWLGQGWGLVADPADAGLLIVISGDGSDGFSLWRECRVQYPVERMVAYGANNFPPDAIWRLRRKPNEKSLAVLHIFNVLTRVSDSLMPPVISGAIFNPKEYLQGVIADAMKDGISRVCSMAGRVEFYISPKETTCYALDPLEALVPLFLAHRESIGICEISDEELSQKLNFASFSSRLSRYAALAESLTSVEGVETRTAKPYAMEEIVWLATLVNSQGRRLSDCPFDEFNRIIRWPESVHSPFYQDYLPELPELAIAGIRIRELAEKAGTSQRQLVDIHNACAVLRLVYCDDSAKRGPECFALAQREIYRAFKPISANTAGRIKVIISGPVGAGKSTAIHTLGRCSQVELMDDYRHSVSDNLDHGEIRFDNLLIRLYGTPDQRRYGFIGDILCNNARGLLFLVGNNLTDPIAELDFYLGRFKANLPGLRVAVGVTFYERKNQPSLEDYRDYLSDHGLSYPVIPVNPENPMDLAKLLKCLA